MSQTDIIQLIRSDIASQEDTVLRNPKIEVVKDIAIGAEVWVSITGTVRSDTVSTSVSSLSLLLQTTFAFRTSNKKEKINGTAQAQ